MGEHKKRSKKAEQAVEDQAPIEASPVVKKDKKEKKEKKEKSEKKEESEKKEKKIKAKKTAQEEKEGSEKKDQSEKKEKKDKKRKRSDEDEDADTPVPTTNGDNDAAAEEAPKKKKKKSSSKDDATTTKAKSPKSSKKKSRKSEKTTNGDAAETQEACADAEAKPEDDAEAQPSGKNSRFICFIGNLPYTATTNAVRAHFATLEPTDVRLLTHKDNPTKSKGIAFVEFGRYDRMKTCLEKFHHSEFNDNVSPARKINVELTAGGGGKKSDVRKDKIKAKNHKLNEERVRRMQEEEAAKLAKDKKKGDKKPEAKEQHNVEDDIHPSRRGWVPYKK